MKYLLGIIIWMTVMNKQLIFDFNKDSNIQGWRIVDDVVMGGRSSGSFRLSPDGFGLFEGQISLENNGGFSSVSYRFQKLKVNKGCNIILKLKGDGKNYQVRVKDDSSHSYSYIIPFGTSGEWQEILIPLRDMYPSFRGRRLDLPNFSGDSIEEIVFLIGNKTSEKFTLLIEKIALD
jgi:NADH dehydrogenase [ubiquinone] 1 alpha subcomplex assembly factor 1